MRLSATLFLLTVCASVAAVINHEASVDAAKADDWRPTGEPDLNGYGIEIISRYVPDA